MGEIVSFPRRAATDPPRHLIGRRVLHRPTGRTGTVAAVRSDGRIHVWRRGCLLSVWPDEVEPLHDPESVG